MVLIISYDLFPRKKVPISFLRDKDRNSCGFSAKGILFVTTPKACFLVKREHLFPETFVGSIYPSLLFLLFQNWFFLWPYLCVLWVMTVLVVFLFRNLNFLWKEVTRMSSFRICKDWIKECWAFYIGFRCGE